MIWFLALAAYIAVLIWAVPVSIYASKHCRPTTREKLADYICLPLWAPLIGLASLIGWWTHRNKKS